MQSINQQEAFERAIMKPLQEKVIFIVEREEISLYQEALLHQSKMKAYMGIRIYTFESYLRTLISHEVPTLSKMERYVRILMCLNREDFLLLKQKEQLSLVEKIDEACQWIHDHQIDLDVDMSQLTLFSQHKLLDLKKIYASLKDGYPDFLIALSTLKERKNETLYLVHPESLTRYQKMVLEQLEKKGVVVYALKEDVGDQPWQWVIHQSLWQEQAPLPIRDHPFWMYQASSKVEEIKMLCSDIAMLLDQGIDPDHIAIYLHDPHDGDLLYTYSQRAHLPMAFKEKEIRSLCFRFFQSVMRYWMEDDLHACFECLKIMGLKHPVECQQKMDIEHEEAFQEEETYLLLRTQKEQFHQAKTLQEKSLVLESLLPYVQQDVEGLPAFETYLEKTKSFDLVCSSELYKQWFDTFYHDVVRKQKESMHHVRLYSHDESILFKVGIQYIYMIGMNEGVVPKTLKDHDLLLEEEKSLWDHAFLLKDQRRLEQQRLMHVLSQPVKRFVCSYSSLEEDGTIKLPSSLCLKLKSLFEIPMLTYTMHPLFEEDYLLKYGLHTELQRDFIERQFQSETLTSTEIFHKDHDFRFSASQLECYNQCPFQYYLRYGMRVSSIEDPLLMPNEIGNLTHHVFDTLSDLLDVPWASIQKTEVYQRYVHEEIEDISTCLSLMIEACLEEYLSQYLELKAKISRFHRNQHLFKRLKENLVLHLMILHHQQALSQFRLLKHEDQVYGTSPRGYALYGRLDRLDTYQEMLRIIDYKSSQKKIDLSLAIQGFNIQMLLYLDLASKKYHQQRGVVSYYSSQPRIFKMDKPLTFEDVLKAHASSGYMLKDESLILAVDREIYERPSPVYGLRYVKSRQDFSGDLLDGDAWQGLFEMIYRHIDTLIEDIQEGKIAIMPTMSKDKTTMSKVNPCHYCAYHPICQRDFFYHEGREIKTQKAEEIKRILGGKKDESIE